MNEAGSMLVAIILLMIALFVVIGLAIFIIATFWAFLWPHVRGIVEAYLEWFNGRFDL